MKGLDPARSTWVRLDLFAKTGDASVDAAIGDEAVVTPHRPKNLIPGKRSARMPTEKDDQIELLRLKRNLPSGSTKVSPGDIDFVRPEAKGIAVRRGFPFGGVPPHE
jgi:hypothetical protein